MKKYVNVKTIILVKLNKMLKSNGKNTQTFTKDLNHLDVQRATQRMHLS